MIFTWFPGSDWRRALLLQIKFQHGYRAVAFVSSRIMKPQGLPLLLDAFPNALTNASMDTVGIISIQTKNELPNLSQCKKPLSVEESFLQSSFCSWYLLIAVASETP